MTAAPAGARVGGTSLRLGGRLLRRLGLAGAIIVLLVGLAELAARSAFVARYLPQPAWFKLSSHPAIDGRFKVADQIVAKGGTIDCFFLGPSPVRRGVNTQVFGAAYRSRTGRGIECVNFGIGGAAEPAVAMIAPILMARYHPRLFIVGTGARTEEMGRPLERELMDEPWLRWQRGEWSGEGWLIERSVAYRRILGMRRWLGSRRQSLTAGMPFEGADARVPRWRERPAPDAWKRQFLRDAESDLQPSEGRLAALENVLRILGPGRVAVFALPTNPLYLAALRERGAGYDRQMAAIAERATRSGAQFFRLEALDLPPVEGWRDATHLTEAGAELFSRWLGERVGEAVNQGLLPDPAAQAAAAGNSG